MQAFTVRSAPSSNPYPDNDVQEIEVQVKEYQAFVVLLNNVPFLKAHLQTFPSAKNTLAFLVHELKKTEPQCWQESLQTLKNRIVIIMDMHRNNLDDATSEVSWILDQTKTKLYCAAIFAKISEARTEGNRKKMEYFERSLRIEQNCQSINSSLHSQNQRVSFGGIIGDFIPQWA